MATWLHSQTYVHFGARKIDDRLSGEFGRSTLIIGEEDEKQVWGGAVGFTRGNENQRSQLTGTSKGRRNCGARHAVHITQFLNC